MVTGGLDGSDRLDSTEIYTDTTSAWRIVAGKLPATMYHLTATTFDNRVLVFGKMCYLAWDFRNNDHFRWI